MQLCYGKGSNSANADFFLCGVNEPQTNVTMLCVIHVETFWLWLCQ